MPKKEGETPKKKKVTKKSKSKEDHPEEPIELLSPKQNGSTVDGGDGAHSSNKQSIKGMWKKAFRSLKVKDKEKDTAKAANEETSSRYSRQLRQQQSVTEDMSSRQSSLKRVLRRKVSEEVSDQEPVPEEAFERSSLRRPLAGGEIDPVYSLLKCAADLPRGSTTGAKPMQGHACCMRDPASSNQTLNVRSTSRSSSPSSDSDAKSSSSCSCPCHTPQVLENYHASLINKKT